MSVINEQIYQQIKKFIFVDKDPFDLDIKDFPKIRKDVDTLKKFYENIIIWLCKEDRAGGLAYELVSNKIIAGEYATLDYSSNNYKNIADILKKISVDEYEHAEFDEFLYHQIYKKSYDDNISIAACEAITQFVAEESFENMLLQFYIGECHTWALQYNFIKFSNSDKKDILKLMIAEEHYHIRLLEEIILNHSGTFDKSVFVTACGFQRYPIIPYIENLLNIQEYNVSTKTKLENIYNNEWLQHFKLLFYEKTFPLYSKLFSETSFKDFENTIDHYYPQTPWAILTKKQH